MIELTTLNNKQFFLNCELFEKIEVTPDTIITLTNGKIYVVRESPDVIIERIVHYKRMYLASCPEVIK